MQTLVVTFLRGISDSNLKTLNSIAQNQFSISIHVNIKRLSLFMAGGGGGGGGSIELIEKSWVNKVNFT